VQEPISSATVSLLVPSFRTDLSIRYGPIRDGQLLVLQKHTAARRGHDSRPCSHDSTSVVNSVVVQVTRNGDAIDSHSTVWRFNRIGGGGTQVSLTTRGYIQLFLSCVHAIISHSQVLIRGLLLGGCVASQASWLGRKTDVRVLNRLRGIESSGLLRAAGSTSGENMRKVDGLPFRVPMLLSIYI
jgi:hypothetical protein